MIEEIKALFPERAPISNIGMICYSITDEEAVFETSAFLNKSWVDVEADLWEKHWDVVAWFSDYGLYYFLPSLMIHSLIDYEKVALPVDWFFSHLYGTYPLSRSSFRVDRWYMFSSDQCELILKWLRSISDKLDDGLEGSLKDMLMAEAVLLDLRDELLVAEQEAREPTWGVPDKEGEKK